MYSTSLTPGQPTAPREDPLLAACPVFGGHLTPQEEFESKSERWQDGDNGFQVRTWIEQWEMSLDEVDLDLPEQPRFSRRLLCNTQDRKTIGDVDDFQSLRHLALNSASLASVQLASSGAQIRPPVRSVGK